MIDLMLAHSPKDRIECGYDGKVMSFEEGCRRIDEAGLACIAYTTGRYEPELPEWRLLLPLANTIVRASGKSSDELEQRRSVMVARVNGVLGGVLASESFTLSQGCFYGRALDKTFNMLVIEGRAVDKAHDLDAGALPFQDPKKKEQPALPLSFDIPARQAPEGGTELGRAVSRQRCDAIRCAADDGKHNAFRDGAMDVAGQVRRGNLDEAVAWEELVAAAESRRADCDDFAKAMQTLRNSFRDGLNKATENEKATAHGGQIAADLLAREEAKRDAALADAEEKIAAAKAKAAVKPTVRAALLDVDGMMKLSVDECVASAPYPQPFLALGAAICAIGVLAGRKYRTETDLRTNIYIAAIAPSGGGKDHPMEATRRAIDAAGLDRYLSNETIASGRALLSAMEGHPAKLFLVDELGLFLDGVAGRKVPTHRAEIMAELMKLYSRAKDMYRGTEYANKKENPRVNINQPCTCLYGATTPDRFWEALQGGAMIDGSLARFLVFLADGERPPRNWDGSTFESSDTLRDGLRAIARGAGPLDRIGNLAANLEQNCGIAMIAADKPEPHTVAMTADARQLYRSEHEKIDERGRQARSDTQASVTNRIAENAAKLALIRAR